MREVDTASGFCTPCVIERAAESYSAEDRRRAEERTRRWGDVAKATRDDARLATLRQQRHRLIEAIRPRKDAAVYDPWELAREALEFCRRIGQSYPAGRTDLEEIAEVLRRLAWGPDEGTAMIARPRPRHRRQIPGQLMLWIEDGVEVAA
jgi:hypothetical protein